MIKIADCYEQLGNREMALQWIKKAIDNGYPDLLINREPGFKDLRADERYLELVSNIKKKNNIQ